MQNGPQAPLKASARQPDCAFCQRSQVTDILYESAHFLLAADHAPLVEGHLLIIPRDHYACYGDVPPGLDEELFGIKNILREFYEHYYAPVVFWEHGVFRQSVFHAHLHCFPWGNLAYDIASNIHSAVVNRQEDIRSWYHGQGHYFYLENEQVALLFAPEMERYMYVMQQIFQKGMAAMGHAPQYRTAQQRQDEGQPLINATLAQWHAFLQQQKVK